MAGFAAGLGMGAALLLGGLADAAPAPAADVAGPWTVSAEFGRSLRYTLVCVFEGSGPGFAGPCAARTGKALPTNGRVSGDRVQFSYRTDYNGSGLQLVFMGRRGADASIKGSVTANASQGVFQAQPLFTDPADGAVTYKVSVAFSDELKYVDLCTLRPEGARLSGPCAVTEGASLPVTGSADGASVGFGHDTTFEGKPVHLDYNGTLSGGAITGAVRAGGQVGTFTARRP